MTRALRYRWSVFLGSRSGPVARANAQGGPRAFDGASPLDGLDPFDGTAALDRSNPFDGANPLERSRAFDPAGIVPATAGPVS